MEYILLSVSLIIIGLALITKSSLDFKKIDRSSTDFFQPTPIKILDVNLVHSNLSDSLSGPLTEKSSMVIVRYEYSVNGRAYQSRQVFPMDVEWIKPRVSPFTLFEDIKANRILQCFVDIEKPYTALLFRGWSPYLKKNIIGVCSAGVVVILLGVFSFFMYL